MKTYVKVLAAAAVIYAIVSIAYFRKKMGRGPIPPGGHDPSGAKQAFRGRGRHGGPARWGGAHAGRGSRRWRGATEGGRSFGGLGRSPSWWWYGWGDWPGWDAQPSWRWSYEYPEFYRWLAATYPDFVASVRSSENGAVSMADLKPYLCARAGLSPLACLE